ncbi:hypothetical protein [Helicobacter typhlonius]|uniref:hypothetical protein n=1 Tax=Helicobacter typhlonius TaxID=76936 RepID=UPI002FE07113
MLFSSFIFIFAFLPLALLGFYTLQAMKQYTLAKVFLIGTSLFFYGYFKVEYVFILIASVLVNFYLARLILANGGGGIYKGKMYIKAKVNVKGEKINIMK